MSSPSHRLPVDADVIDGNKYVLKIAERRALLNDFKSADGSTIGPIKYGLEEVENFACSASERGEEHLALFQAVILNEQPTKDIYPKLYLPKIDDPAMKSLEDAGLFMSTRDDVKRGLWNSHNASNNFFLDLAQLIIGAAAPRQSIPNTRTVRTRESKAAAREQIELIVQSPDHPVTGGLGLRRILSPESKLHGRYC